MKIEDVEELETQLEQSQIQGHGYQLCETLLKALRAEAWHPIEKAEELGAKDGRTLLGYIPLTQEFKLMHWNFDKEKWLDIDFGCYIGYSHFRFINPPEGA